MTSAIAIATLKKIFDFDPSLSAALDLSASSLRITYLSEPIIGPLSRGLPYLKPILAVLEDDKGQRGSHSNTTIGPKDFKPYRTYEGTLDDLLPAHRFRRTRDQFIRILLGSKELLHHQGFGISTPKISKQLGVSQQLIWRYRRSCERDGWLVVASTRHFIPGQKAIRFRASGQLAVALKALHSISISKMEIPNSIPDGHWHRTLGTLIKELSVSHTLEEVIAVISKIEGAKVGTRLKQARGWYLWWKKRRTFSKSESVDFAKKSDAFPQSNIAAKNKKLGVKK
jgi:hypothetical protein